jgi:hypothetical protein
LVDFVGRFGSKNSSEKDDKINENDLRRIVLSCVLQGGNFEASTFFIGASLVSVLCLACDVSNMMYSFSNVFKTDKIRRISLISWLICGLMSLFVLIATGLAMYFSRFPTDEADLANLIFTDVAYIVLMGFLGLAMRHTDEFLTLLREKNVSKYDDISVRIRRMKRKWLLLILGNLPALPLVGIIRHVLGSIPYLWVMYMLILPSFLFGANSIVVMYPSSNSTSSSNSGSRSREGSKISKVEHTGSKLEESKESIVVGSKESIMETSLSFPQERTLN